MSECLSCLDLTKRFGAKEALRSVNFKLEKGRIVGRCWDPTAAERPRC